MRQVVCRPKRPAWAALTLAIMVFLGTAGCRPDESRQAIKPAPQEKFAWAGRGIFFLRYRCPFCRLGLAKLHEELKARGQQAPGLLLAFVDSQPPSPHQLAKLKQGIPLAWAGPARELLRRFKATSLPALCLVGRDGRLMGRWEGASALQQSSRQAAAFFAASSGWRQP